MKTTSNASRRPQAPRVSPSFESIKLVLAFCIVLVGLTQTPGALAASDYVYEPFSAWNGKKVYLSPARHSDAGDRGECQGRNGMGDLDENTAALLFALYATAGDWIGEVRNPTSQYRNLRSRGYKVRIGRGTVASAIKNSNAWASTVHIPIHSNARPEDCKNTDAKKHGTHVIYKSYGESGGQGLSDHMKYTIGRSSPGTNDLICHNSSNCTLFNCLGELCKTKAKAAYLEREFHTWNKGAAWLKKDYANAWRLGWAIDLFLGYPR